MIGAELYGINNHTSNYAPLPSLNKDPAMTEHATWTGIGRGFCRRCPACGRGALFRGFLTIQPHCPSCGAYNTAYPSDDLPPYLTILIAGHLIVPSLLWLDSTFAPALWIQFATWLPLTTLLTIGLLPFVKGGAVGLCWATGTVRPQPVPRPDRHDVG
jgi:uncharacterized protein (DUF983 family)